MQTHTLFNPRLLLAAAVLLVLCYAPDCAAAGASAATEDLPWGMISAALATGLATLGAGFAVGRVGSAAVGALAEKPDLFGRLVVFLGLAEGIAIYGLIVSILILNRTP